MYKQNTESARLSGGVDRIEEICALSDRPPRTPSMKLFPKDKDFDAHSLLQLRMVDITRGWVAHSLSHAPQESRFGVCTILLKKAKMCDYRVSARMVAQFIEKHKLCPYASTMSYSSCTDAIWFLSIFPSQKMSLSDLYFNITHGSEKYVLRGMPNITDFYETTMTVNNVQDGIFCKTEHRVISVTLGSNIRAVSDRKSPWYNLFFTLT